MNYRELVEEYDEAVGMLVACIRGIVDAWEEGDLAGAVNTARETADEYAERFSLDEEDE